jgi:hypothetical protein
MAVLKKSTRKKLSKYLSRLVKKHGAEMTLALLGGIVSSLAADGVEKAGKTTKKKSDQKNAKKAKAAAEPVVVKKGPARRTPATPPARPVVARKRAER